MPVRAVIFDLDGLMVDSEPLAKQAWRALLARYGHVLDAETMGATYGLRPQDSARLIHERYDLPLSAEEVSKAQSALFWEQIEEGLKPMPGINELLAAVDARGLPRAVATASGRAYAPLALRAAGIADGFQALITGQDVAHGKPAPDIFLAAAHALDVAPTACMALEDSALGIQSARTAGMLAVAVPNQMTAKLDFTPAHRVMPSLAAVLEALDELLAAEW